MAKAYARTIGLGSDDLQKEVDSLRTSLSGLNEDLAKFSEEQKRVTGSTAVIDDRLPKVEPPCRHWRALMSARPKEAKGSHRLARAA